MDKTQMGMKKRVTTKMDTTKMGMTKRVTTKMGMIIMVFLFMEFTLIQE
ncbi:hypothetical protein HX854_06985 [Marine Group I thaumarchaeote]|uniref:Uncharacterized protein n=1 Tax=Marine Group I thaumarchaeote TaxID=2511932 RepID=A0A7K4N7V4_9ARCH|nr:hypothetical protein [Marine Group I thaumarchaeote]